MLNQAGSSTAAENSATIPAPMQGHSHELSHPHQDPRHVHQSGANQPMGTMDMHESKRDAEAGQFVPPQQQQQGVPPMAVEQPVQIVEQKMPFKDQVRAYTKIHRGTLLGDREEKELGKKMLAGEVPPQ
jgi:hypothetical protein